MADAVEVVVMPNEGVAGVVIMEGNETLALADVLVAVFSLTTAGIVPNSGRVPVEAREPAVVVAPNNGPVVLVMEGAVVVAATGGGTNGVFSFVVVMGGAVEN